MGMVTKIIHLVKQNFFIVKLSFLMEFDRTKYEFSQNGIQIID
jgi:hypothetical protein